MSKSLVRFKQNDNLSNFFNMNEFDNFFRDVFDGMFKPSLASEDFVLTPKSTFGYPKIDVYETKDKLTVEVDVGSVYKKEDISLSVRPLDGRENILKIHLSSKEENKEDDKERQYHFREICRRSYDRVLRLPERFDAKNISSTFKDSLLRIEIPKLAEPEKKEEEYKVEIN